MRLFPGFPYLREDAYVIGRRKLPLDFASSEARGDLGPLVVVDVGAEHPGIRKCRAPRSVYVASDREPRKFRMQVSAR
jgi:hypothetical protein